MTSHRCFPEYFSYSLVLHLVDWQSFKDHCAFTERTTVFLESGCKITAFFWTDQILRAFFCTFFVTIWLSVCVFLRLLYKKIGAAARMHNVSSNCNSACPVDSPLNPCPLKCWVMHYSPLAVNWRLNIIIGQPFCLIVCVIFLRSIKAYWSLKQGDVVVPQTGA